jgi:uncharacterized protein (TIGR02145 family)
MKRVATLIVCGLVLAQCAAQSRNGTVRDIDGNVYSTVKIGAQVWTAENFKTTKFNDGTPIALVTDSVKWCALQSAGYCLYKNNMTYKKKFGALYNYYAVISPRFAPKGWHVPTAAEWDSLSNFLTAHKFNCLKDNSDYRITKALAAKTDWEENPDGSTNPCVVGVHRSENNSSGFSALPGGTRQNCDYRGMTISGHWWGLNKEDSPGGEIISIDSYSEDFAGTIDSKDNGCSVRLIQDNK